MSLPSSAENLSEMVTCWTKLNLAHQGSESEQHAARSWLVQTYEPVVRRYLQGAASKVADLRRDPETVDDMVAAFVERTMEGKFQTVDPSRRFRYYLKGCLSHLVCDFIRAARRRDDRFKALEFDPADEGLPTEAEEAEIWRSRLLETALERLQKEDERASQPRYFAAVLRSSLQYPDLYSHQLVEKLAPLVHKKDIDSGWVRTQISRGKDRLAQHLIDLAQELLGTTNPAELDEELRALGLGGYCEAVRRLQQ